MATVGILTLHPEGRGGVWSMAESVAKHVGLEHDVTLVYRRRVPRGPFQIIRKVSQLFHKTLIPSSYRGWKALEVGSGLGIHHTLDYLEWSGAWTAALDRFEHIVVVGGSAHAGTAVIGKKPYVLWVATPYLEDRIDRMRLMGAVKSSADKLFLKLALAQEERALGSARHVFALSNYTRDCLVKRYALDEKSVSVIGFQVNSRFSLKPTGPSDSHVAPGRTILFVGRLNDPRKNLSLLLQSFSGLVQRLPDVKLSLVGEILGGKLSQEVKDLGLSNKVENFGRLEGDQLAAQYRHADLFVIPSNQEGLCIAGLEALSAGLPVVSTKCGGPEDFIFHGANGFLTDIGDVEGMKARMFEALSEPSFLSQAGMKSKRIARALRDERFGEKILEPLLLATA